MALWGFVLVGFIAQLVDGSMGMGFGVISSSFLIGLGIAPALASASVHTAEIFTTMASGTSHLKLGNVKKEWVKYLVVPGVLGGAAGAAFLSSIPGNTMKPYVATLLLIMGILMLYRFIKGKRIVIGKNRGVSRVKLIITGLIASFFDAVGGGGWGPIATPGLVLTENEEPRKVIGTVNFAEFFVTLSEAITFLAILGAKSYNWSAIGMILLGGVACAPAAAWLTKKLPPRILGILVGLTVIAYNIRTLWQALFKVDIGMIVAIILGTMVAAFGIMLLINRIKRRKLDVGLE